MPTTFDSQSGLPSRARTNYALSHRRIKLRCGRGLSTGHQDGLTIPLRIHEPFTVREGQAVCSSVESNNKTQLSGGTKDDIDGDW